MSLKSPTLETPFKLAHLNLPRDLGDGLVLRLATVDDTEPLAQFTGRVFGREQFDELAATYTRDTMRPTHPVIGPGNTLIVEDTRAQKIASSTILIPQTWTYAGIPFGVGRPEMVATDPAYRRRGLVRVQFDVLHALSDALGHLAQSITGIPWYYRQFGYEYALDLSGGRTAYFSNIPALKENETEPYRLREMTCADIPFVAVLYERDCARSLVTCPRPEWLWRYLLDADPTHRAWRIPAQIIETPAGRAVGYVQPTRDIWMDASVVDEFAVSEGQSVRAVLPSVLRWLKPHAETEASRQKKLVTGITFAFGREHPVFDAAPDLLPKVRPPYGWYIRVPDVPRLLRAIAPALEMRLARSVVAGFSGELKISEYRSGYKLGFENGKLGNVETWQPTPEESGDCSFPPLVFLQLLFGAKSLSELRAQFPDVWAKDEPAVLVNALFPKMYSCVVPVG